MTWKPEIFGELADAHEVEVVVAAPGRAALRVPIWVVAAGGELYVRSWKGDDGRWYRRARSRGAGALATTGGDHEVRFVPPGDPGIEAAVDRAYLDKYRGSPYAEAMVRPPATGTTLRIDPAG